MALSSAWAVPVKTLANDDGGAGYPFRSVNQCATLFSLETKMTSDPRIPRATAEPPAPAAIAKADLRSALAGGAARHRRGHAHGVGPCDSHARAGVVARAARRGAGRVLAAARRAGPARGLRGTGAAGVRLLLPVVVEKHAALEFAQWQIGEAMVKDAMGVAVPAQLADGGVSAGAAGALPGLQSRRLPARIRRRILRPHAGARAAAADGGRWPTPAWQADFDSDAHDIALDVMVTEAGSLRAGS